MAKHIHIHLGDSLVTVVGPLKTEAEAKSTARSLGIENHSVYSKIKKDKDGYETKERDWYVERDTSVASKTIMGMSWQQIQAKQQRR